MNGIYMEKTLVDRRLSPYSDSSTDISKLDIIIPDRTSPELTIKKIIPIQKYCYFDSDDEKTNDVRLLSEYVTNFIKNDNTDKKKYPIEITNKIVSMLRLLLNSSFFFDTEFFFISIVKGDKIDADKVPFIMDLLIELYKNLKGQIRYLDMYHCGEIMKLFFSIAVYENIVRIRIKKNKEQVISCFDNIIEMSVCISKIDEPRIGMFKCIRNIFG
jgi:hypothetical protein